MALVIAAGGTGGHVFPALAVAEAWRRRWPTDPIYWVGAAGGKEASWINSTGIPYYGVPAAGWQPRRRWRNLRLFYQLPAAFFAVEKLFQKLHPKGVFSTGGYPGLMPAVWAVLHRRPLYLLELNRHAGRTIRWMSRFASETFGAFPETGGLRSARWIGVPVRFRLEDRSRYTSAFAKVAWGFPAEQPLILVLGGSQGSSTLNSAVAACLSVWTEAGASILWQVGKNPPASIPPSVKVLPFISDMGKAYLAADIVISRAGGSTLGELAWWGKASVLVPSPYVAEDHQRKNAAYWAEHGAALVVEESDTAALREAVLALLRSPEQRGALEEAAARLSRPSAAEELAEYLHTALYGVS